MFGEQAVGDETPSFASRPSATTPEPSTKRSGVMPLISDQLCRIAVLNYKVDRQPVGTSHDRSGLHHAAQPDRLARFNSAFSNVIGV